MSKKILIIALFFIVIPGLALAKNDNANSAANGNKVTATVLVSTTPSPANGNSAKNDPIKLKAQDWQKELNEYKTASQAQKLTQLREMANVMVANRITALESLKTRISEMTEISTETKTQLLKDVDEAIANINELKTKIENSGTLTELKNLIRELHQEKNVYAVILPKELGLTAVARGQYILGRLTALETKLQSIIDKAGSSSAQIAKLKTDFDAQLTQARAQLEIAESKFKAMTPANTEAAKTSREEGKAAFKAAKLNLKTAHSILKQIIDLLRASAPSASATVSPSASIDISPSVSVSVSPSTTVSPTVTTTPSSELE